MDEQIRKSLLTKKNLSFDKLYQQCTIKIQRIKQKNDFLQKQIGVEIQDEMKSEVHKQKQFLLKQIRDIKEVMNEIASRFKDPESKNKLKILRVDSQKQIERNRIILKDLITKSFMRRSYGDGDNDQVNQYMSNGKVHYEAFDHDKEKKQSVLTDQLHDHNIREIQIDMDMEIQRKIQKQKNDLLNQVEQTTQRVNNIMNDMAVQVNQQGQNLDYISDQLLKTNKNMVNTNQQLQEASQLQRKSRKKYILFALLIIIVVAVILGIVFIVK